MVVGMGTPIALLEKCFDIELINALELLERTIGSKINSLIPLETGAFNTMVPIYAGAKKGLPTLDADGAGRAVPELEMLMFNFYNISPSPFAIADKKSNAAVVYTENSYDCEKDCKKYNLGIEYERRHSIICDGWQHVQTGNDTWYSKYR